MRFYREQVSNILEKPYLFVFYTFVISFAISCSGLIQGIRNFFVLYLLILGLLYFRLKNLFLASFITFFFSLQFVNPNKYYDIEVIRAVYILEKTYSNGYSISYFFHLATFLAVPTIIFFVIDLYRNRLKIPHNLKFLFQILLISFVGFCFSAIYSSSRLSPFPALSYTWIFQYCFMYIVAGGLIYSLVMYPKFRKILVSTILIICFIQSLLSLGQLFFQRSVGLPFESQFAGMFSTGLDENNAVFRVFGTFMFHNQLALVMSILYSFFLSFAIKKNSSQMFFVSAVTFTILLLTQSRSILLAAALFTLLMLRNYYKLIHRLIQKIGVRKVSFYAMVIFILSALGIIPRILLSVNTGYEGAGLFIRIKMIKEGIEAMTASIFFGYGIGTNEYVLQKLFPDGVMSVFPAAIHMGFLQMILEVGIIGLIFFLLPFFFLIRKIFIIKGSNQDSDIFKYAFLGGVLSIISYWSFLPHLGIIEFAFFGITLGFGCYWYYSIQNKRSNEKNLR
jgi:hypothetical protein